MNKEESQQMFGVDSISDWRDDISVGRDFILDEMLSRLVTNDKPE